MTTVADDSAPADGTAAHEQGGRTPAGPAHGADSRPSSRGSNDPERRSALVPVLSTLVGALVAGMFVLAAVGFSTLRGDIKALDAKIDGLDIKIDTQSARLDTKIEMLRADMNEGFAAVNEILLDHAERLARIEALHALPHAHAAVPGTGDA